MTPPHRMTCEEAEERLPLLRYADELPHDERVGLLAHLEACPPCRAVRAQDERAAGAIDRVPLRHPAAARLQGLKARVLARVAPGCPREADVALRASGELEPEERASLDLHLLSCAPCRDAARAFGRVDALLDRAPPLPRARLAAQRAALLARLAPAAPAAVPAAPRGQLLAWPGLLLRVAAGVLVLAGVFSVASGSLRHDPSPDLVALAKRGADELVRAKARAPGDAGWIPVAAAGYGKVVEAARREPRLAATAAEARRELRALAALARVEQAPSREREQALEELLVAHPDAPATFECALLSLHETVHRGTVASPITDSSTESHVIEWWRLDDSTKPDNLRWLTNPRVLQAVVLQRAMRLEELGDVVRARALYRDVLAKGPDAPAARVARERLARLG